MRRSAKQQAGAPSVFLLLILVVGFSHPLTSGFRQEGGQSVEEIVKSSIDAVVLVVVSDPSGEQRGQGSGFLISPDGTIVTNFHVIDDAHSAVVKLRNGAFCPVDGVLAIDKKADLALIKVACKGLPSLALGEAGSLAIGARVVAIGSPLGLQNTVSDGIVSSVRDGTDGQRWIQTTAPASPGNSGGPLLDSRGNVVGVITFQVVTGQNLNFAVPIESVKSLLASAREVTPFSALDTVSTGGVRVSHGRLWTSMTSGRDYKIWFDGDYMYTEWVDLPTKLRGTMAFSRCEAVRSEDKWVGQCRSLLPCQYRDFWGVWVTNWCRLEADAEVTSISESRI